jgi:hypothetical protein
MRPTQYMLDLETANTCEGTDDIHILSIWRDITGLDAFSCEQPEGSTHGRTQDLPET